jgi:hypothetical protein
MAKKLQAAAGVLIYDDEEDDNEQIAGEFSGAFFWSIENLSQLTFKELASPTPSEKLFLESTCGGNREKRLQSCAK